MTEQTFAGANRGPRFQFVVVADTHVNEGERISTSPYVSDHLATPRTRHVFAEIAAMDPPPRFVVHLGDIVHPVPSLPEAAVAVERFKAIASQLAVPLHLIPGNHDVGDKPVDWMPAKRVCDEFLATYREAFGADFHAFDDGGVRFVMMNSLLLNSGLADEPRQRAWLEERIDTAGDLRVFLFMHYPPYIYRPDEASNYDNVDEPARTWLLEQIAKPAVEAVFAGHVHNFWYHRAGEAEMYLLPSTSFLRHDFSEFCQVVPPAESEYGRDDAAKCGYFRVDVFDDGHVAYAVRSHGRERTPDESAAMRSRRHLAHPKTSGFGNAGVELRHPWTESMPITATGGAQEFGRKRARNDYPLLALWEMGVRLCKAPAVDALESESRDRMRHMARIGHRYVVTVVGTPNEALVEAAGGDTGVFAYEANLALERFEDRRGALRALRETSGASIFLAKILTDREARISGKTFTHFVKSGFTVDEAERHRALIAGAIERGKSTGSRCGSNSGNRCRTRRDGGASSMPRPAPGSSCRSSSSGRGWPPPAPATARPRPGRRRPWSSPGAARTSSTSSTPSWTWTGATTRVAPSSTAGSTRGPRRGCSPRSRLCFRGASPLFRLKAGATRRSTSITRVGGTG